MTAARAAVWLAVLAVALVPVAIAAGSPYLAYRDLAYIVGGFAGIACLPLLLLQPLLAAGYLPGPAPAAARRWHLWLGLLLVAATLVHVGGLYLTSPADTLDALLLVAPTPFSVYGVLALAGIGVTALLVALRRRVPYRTWRLVHNGLALVVAVAVVVHAVQIEGAMGLWSKWALCLAVLAATAVALADLRLLRPLSARRRQAAAR
jgi:hypothetical protein